MCGPTCIVWVDLIPFSRKVTGHGYGTYDGFRSNRVGANEHVVAFHTGGTKTLKLKHEAGRNRQGVQGARLNPLGLFLNRLGLFLRASIPFAWRILSAFLRA
jgi:hypothetical protein